MQKFIPLDCSLTAMVEIATCPRTDERVCHALLRGTNAYIREWHRRYSEFTPDVDIVTDVLEHFGFTNG